MSGYDWLGVIPVALLVLAALVMVGKDGGWGAVLFVVAVTVLVVGGAAWADGWRP